MKPLLLTCLFLLTTCARRVELHTADGPGWTAQETRKDQWIIFASDDQSRLEALDELCNPTKFICAAAPVGTVTAITRAPKGRP